MKHVWSISRRVGVLMEMCVRFLHKALKWIPIAWTLGLKESLIESEIDTVPAESQADSPRAALIAFIALIDVEVWTVQFSGLCNWKLWDLINKKQHIVRFVSLLLSYMYLLYFICKAVCTVKALCTVKAYVLLMVCSCSVTFCICWRNYQQRY